MRSKKIKTMDFINQVKQLKEQTKSPEVRQICENYLNGGSNASKEAITSAINEHFSNAPESLNVQNYREVIKNEEMQTAKRMADSLMESWGSTSKPSLNNSGSYISNVNDNSAQKMLTESMETLSNEDPTAKAFVEAQGLNIMGIMEAISTIRNSSIYDHPGVKIVCEKYAGLIQAKAFPEFSLINNFVAETAPFKWDDTIGFIVDELSEKASKYSREIEVSIVLERIKSSGSYGFYSELTESLNSWLVSENRSSGLLAKNISKWSFNPVVRNLINYLNVNEASKSTNKLEIPMNSQGESTVSRVYAPVLVESERTLFSIGSTIFEMSEYTFEKVSPKSFSKIPADYLQLVSIANDKSVKINESGISVRFGKKSVRLVEENSEISVYLDRSKLKFRSLGELGKMLSLETGSYLGVNESQTINNIISLYRGYNDIVELDFAKSITSNIYEGLGINLIKANGKIYLHRINEAMRENSLFQVNGTQAVKAVKDVLRYDISEGLTEFLEGEQKVKSVMVNDRTKVLENISKVESEIGKLENLIESNPLYSNSKEIKSAHSLLNNELSVLKEKWNQINLELSKIESEPQAESDLLEDSAFNIGSYIKVKESGETGKVISVDGTSGRYTVLLDNGKTTDLLVNEIVDLEQALNQASEENPETNDADEDGQEEMKESNNFNKSNLKISEQKKILKTLATNHGFAKAPGVGKGEIEMGMDSVHGYNLTMNEAKAKAEKSVLAKAPGDSKLNKGKEGNPKGALETAPGNSKMSKGKVAGAKDLEEAPGKEADTDFDGHDSAENGYDIGYNLREQENGKLAEAPESGKGAKETKSTSSALVAKQNLAKAPGKGKEVDFEPRDENGYNLDESENLKKN